MLLGFFNPAQIEEEERVKAKLREIGFDVFSPKESFVLSPNATNEERNMVFNENIKMIKDCDVFFGITDHKDMGTIWECGTVYGINLLDDRKRKIVYYAETLPEGAPFNVMLQKSADVVVTKFNDLNKLPLWLEIGHVYNGKVE